MLICVTDSSDLLSLVELPGLKLYAVGTRFAELSSKVFRNVLRKAGVEVQRYPTRDTDLIVLGEDPTTAVEIMLGMKYGDNGPPIVSARVFIERFSDVLGPLETRKGVTLEHHLKILRKNMGRVQEAEYPPDPYSRG